MSRVAIPTSPSFATPRAYNVPAVAVRAPSLPTDAVWLNVERPLTDDDLRGRVVLLDFWTYC